MSKLFCFAFLLVACLASCVSAQQTFRRQFQCTDYTSCLCVSLPKMIAAAKGRPATATLTNPATGAKEVYDLSKPLSAAMKVRCAQAQKKVPK